MKSKIRVLFYRIYPVREPLIRTTHPRFSLFPLFFLNEPHSALSDFTLRG